MRTRFDDEHDLFRDTFRLFVEREIAPHLLQWDHAGIHYQWNQRHLVITAVKTDPTAP
jgi:acyl-CoA dehydrogenase-like protein